MRATNQGGSSAWASANAKVAIVPATIGAATPTRGDSTIDLSWTVPNDGGSTLLRYEIECSADSGATYSSCASNIAPSGAEGSAFSATLSGVVNQQGYYLRLRAVNAIGNGNWASVEVLPAQLPSNATNVSLSRDGFSLTATWDAAVNTDSYYVELSEWAVGPTVIQTLTGATETAATFTITDFFKSHTVSVTSKNAFGSGERADSALVRQPAAPDAPASVSGARILGDDSDKIAATWSSVDGASSYDLRYSEDNGTNWTASSTGLTSAKAAIAGLNKQKAYILSARSVRTYTGSGGATATLTGEWSASSSLIHAPPGKATNMSVSGASQSDTTIEWTRPSFTGTGSNSLTYNVYCRRTSSNSWTKIQSKVSDTSDGNVSVVVNDYRCAVRFAEVGITSVNEVEGQIHRHVRNDL